MKCLWKLQKEPDSTWASTVNLLYGSRDIPTLLADGRTSAAFRDILHYNDFFSSSICNPGLPQQLTWKWSTTGEYSSASSYRILADPGMRSPYHILLWKIKAPPKVRIFLWLILLDRILTQQNLARRNWPSITSCQCCSEGCMETSVHLFVHCTFAKQIWTQLQIRFNLPLLAFTTDLPAFWLQNRQTIGPSWDIIWATSSWAIWKERNSRLFASNRLTASRLVVEICATIEVWKKMA
ncbi:RNA-directed DNA polymerase (reverse transcriptase)-related family protein [Rhynchospora pubera]|uniref:RNA-directed DNA polymerase (Reverse transcriptase)-related family protein n=1 Tax=Rhynchospora pubera TaxID=906938 RepID=A0AAV8DZM4_9POAL|nr:RNA-directed DNA polymerase (reverse transcriptase)-related family protein [Rhynchospora pubera]